MQMRSKASNNKNRTDPAPVALIAAAVLLGALASAKVMAFFTGRDRAQDVVERALAQDRYDPNDLKPHLEKAKEMADALKKSNLFIKQPPKQHPVKQVDGILGREALISGKWYKVGDKIGDARILAIKPTEVTVEWEGKEKAFAPLMAEGAKPSPPGRPEGRPGRGERPELPRPGPRAERPQVKMVAPAEDDALAWMGVDLPASVKEKLLEHWNKMSDEEKQEAKEKWNNMSEEQKQQAIEAMGQRT